jgi:cytochrome c peroxidase
MFIIFATKPLNDGTKGFRFNMLGTKGLVRMRKRKSRGLSLFNRNKCMTAHHMGKLTLYVEHNNNTKRKLFHFAG